MVESISKRDGRVVPFESGRIFNAICKAMKETEVGVDTILAGKITGMIQNADFEQLSVEEIQDMVENALMASDRKDVAKCYILYRAERTKQREKKMDIVHKALEKIQGTVIENANANVDEKTFGGRKNEASGALQKQIALDFNMPIDIAEAHKNCWIYQHDLDSYNIGMHNCLFLNFEKLFSDGFSTRNGDVRPPNSFSTACQLVAVAMQVQSQVQFGLQTMLPNKNGANQHNGVSDFAPRLTEKAWNALIA